jgi:hypothetical protein
MLSELLEQLYYVGEFFSALAVVVSLIYVGKQLKQNTKAVRSSTLQNITEAQLNIHALVAENGELAQILFNGAANIAPVEGVEKFRYYSWMTLAFRSLENAYYQHLEGALDDRNWQALCRQYGPMLHHGLNRIYWDERNFMYGDDFRNFVNDKLLATPVQKGWKVPGS